MVYVVCIIYMVYKPSGWAWPRPAALPRKGPAPAGPGRAAGRLGLRFIGVGINV